MSPWRSFLAVVCMSVGAPALADDEAKEAKAVLGRALKALGGEKALKKHPALTGKSTGTVVLMGKKSPATNEWTVQGLDQLKWTTEVELNGKPTTFVIVLGGGKGWIQA